VTLYRTLKSKTIWATATPPDGAKSILLVGDALLPPLITEMHRNFRAWGDRGLSPGPLDPARVYVGADGALAFAFPDKGTPEQLYPQHLAANIGAARDLAGWLLLLDKWMETFVVLARARHIWTPNELAGALPYLAPIYQPAALIDMPPLNWERVARALATAVVDGPLQGGGDDAAPENKHWQKVATARDTMARKPKAQSEDGEQRITSTVEQDGEEQGG
jgi:hypothetical protein